MRRKFAGQVPQGSHAPQEGEAGHDGIPWLKNALVAVALCTIALLAYSDSFRSGFVFDNQGLILQDPRLLQATTKNVELILQHTYMVAQG